MSLRHDTLQSDKINYFEEQSAVQVLHRLFQYVLYAGFGIFGGAISVAFTIAAAIVIQSLMPPLATFSPNVVLLATTAAVLGFGVSWLLAQGLHRILSGSFGNRDIPWLQVTLVFSVLTSLLQTILFMQVL